MKIRNMIKTTRGNTKYEIRFYFYVFVGANNGRRIITTDVLMLSGC